MKTNTFTLKNHNGISLSFTSHGGRITSLRVPDTRGELEDVVIGYDTVDESLRGDLYFGALCGRYANRIYRGKFSIDGTEYQLDSNNGVNHLHGGFDGFNTREWKVVPVNMTAGIQAYELRLISPQGDQRYPGELKVRVLYCLNDLNEFRVEYFAQTSRPTVINLTSHPYFNLKGPGKGDVLDHLLWLNAHQYTPINAEMETSDGTIATVKGTPFDFTQPSLLAEAVKSKHPQITLVNGIDHNFVLNHNTEGLTHAATLKDPASGRTLEVHTDQPGLQIYTANHFNGSQIGKKNHELSQYAGVALETQIFPNSPNLPNFPNAVLRPGETYRHTCVYKFSHL